MKALPSKELETLKGGSTASAIGCGIAIVAIVGSGGSNPIAWLGATVSCGATIAD